MARDRFQTVPAPARLFRAFAPGAVDAVQDQRMTEKHAERRDRIGQQAPQYIFIREYTGRFLAQTQQFRAQIVLHLRAIKTSVDRERRNDIGADTECDGAL